MKTKQHSIDPRRTRDRILEMSLRLLNELGEPNVMTTAIAGELGVSPGSPYYHFHNKDNIIDSIFVQFEQEIVRRLRLSDDYRVILDEIWGYLQYISKSLWNYRSPYRGINNLLAHNRMFELNFKRIVKQGCRFAMDTCHQSIEDDEMEAMAEQVDVIYTDIMVVTAYWLSFQFVQHPRQYNDQNAIRDHLHGANYHILSIPTFHLRDKPRRTFDLLAVSRSNDPPIGAPGIPSNNIPAL